MIHKIRAAGFTLVEMMIVIGVVGLLIAMVLGAVVAARNRSATLNCQSRLRGIGQLFHLYATENHGYAPVATHYRVGLNRSWVDHFMESGVTKSAWTLSCNNWQTTGGWVIGYGMNPYAIAHRAREYGSRESGPQGTRMVAVFDERFPELGGGYVKLKEWGRGGGSETDGILCGDSTSERFQVITWSGLATETLPNGPDTSAFTIDFTRHLGMRGKAGMSTPALNLLYADGRVELSSARDALRALGLVR